MNAPQRNPARRRRPSGHKPRRVDLWRAVPPVAEPAPIVPARDATALLRSLGDPPLQGQGAVAIHYLAAVIERAAVLATALAATANLLAEPDED
jgi:hypothetical protein